jgi:hypothetical protein
MSAVDKLLALGAQSVAGDLIWKGKVLGQSRNGIFSITPDGEAALEIEDAVVIERPAAPDTEPQPVAKPAAKRTPAKKVAAPVEPEPQEAAEAGTTAEPASLDADLDDLLKDL